MKLENIFRSLVLFGFFFIVVVNFFFLENLLKNYTGEEIDIGVLSSKDVSTLFYVFLIVFVLVLLKYPLMLSYAKFSREAFVGFTIAEFFWYFLPMFLEVLELSWAYLFNWLFIYYILTLVFNGIIISLAYFTPLKNKWSKA